MHILFKNRARVPRYDGTKSDPQDQRFTRTMSGQKLVFSIQIVGCTDILSDRLHFKGNFIQIYF